MKIFAPLRFFTLVLLLGLAACETDITSDVKIDTTPKLVVVSFISPQDTALSVSLQKTRPAVGKALTEEQTKVKDATVKLSDGNQTVTLRYVPQINLYRAKASLLPLVAGKTYVLTVTAPGGYATTATCTIPRTEGIRITDIEVTPTIVTYPGGSYTRNTLTYKWQDAPGRANFYHTIGGRREGRDPFNPTVPREELFSFYQWNANHKSFRTDERVDGTILASEPAESNVVADTPMPRPHMLYATLAVTDKDYYQYHQSLLQHQDSDGNPFAEPTMVYSNITGGLGIFAAYNLITGSKRVE